MNLYSIDVRISGTAYIKAASAAEALAKAQTLKMTSLEVEGDIVSDCQFDDPDLPEISLSPAMTNYGPDETIPELVEEDLPEAKEAA